MEEEQKINNIANRYIEYCFQKNIKSVYEHNDLFTNFLKETDLYIPSELYEKINFASLNEWCNIYLEKFRDSDTD